MFCILTQLAPSCYYLVMERLHVVIPKEMKDALDRQSAQRDAPVSALVRLAISDWLYQVGEDRITWRLEWGGHRQSDEENAPA